MNNFWLFLSGVLGLLAVGIIALLRLTFLLAVLIGMIVLVIYLLEP